MMNIFSTFKLFSISFAELMVIEVIRNSMLFFESNLLITGITLFTSPILAACIQISF